MKMKRVVAIYPSTIYGDPTMRAQQMTKRKNLIKNIRVRRPVVLRRPVQIRHGALVRVLGRDRGQKEIHAINPVENEIDDQQGHVRARDHGLGLGPGIAVIVHHIIRAPDLAVGPHRPINGMRPANIVAEMERQQSSVFH